MRLLTENYLKARKCFFKSISGFLNVSLIVVDEIVLLNYISELNSNQEFKTIEEKGPFISSTVLTQIIKAETLSILGLGELNSIKYFNESIDSYNKIITTYAQNNYMFKATILRKMAEVYKNKKEWSKFREFLEKTKEAYIEHSYKKNFQNIIDLNVEIAISYFSCKDLSESINYFEQALAVLMDNNDESTFQLAEIHKFLGMCYAKKEDLDEALISYYKCLDIISVLKLENEEVAFNLYYLICVIFLKKQDYFVSLEYLKKAKGILNIEKETPFQNKFREFYDYYKKYLDYVDENIWTNFSWNYINN